MNYSELLSPVQLKKLLGGNSMSSFIAPATRTKCRECGEKSFVKEYDRRLKSHVPACESCGGDPVLYRVGFTLPKVGTNKSHQLFKTRNEVGEKLDSIQKALSFKDFIANKIKKEGKEFDPREFGTESERKIFLIKYLSGNYTNFLKRKEESGMITPGGYVKKIGVLKNQVAKIFGEYSVKDISYQLIERELYETTISESLKGETVKELKSLLKFASVRGLVKSIPELPKYKRSKTYKSKDFYTLEERDAVIANIKTYRHRIAITMLAKYTRRQCEIRCLRWGDIDLKNNEITFSRHVSDGKGAVKLKELDGLKSSPDKELRYDFFPGLKEMLYDLGPSFKKKDLVFSGRKSYMAKNVLWNAWTNSVKDLMDRKILKKRVDLHRGTRNSTLSALYEAGNSQELLKELYGGNLETMMKHYAKKTKQHVGDLLH